MWEWMLSRQTDGDIKIQQGVLLTKLSSESSEWTILLQQ